MLIELVMRNFQKHEDLTLNFGPGLQVIRGDNEAGKSTIFRAVAYAWWGSRALPESLDETVTDGKPVGSLLVQLTFSHGSTTYVIVRKKSGATLTGSDGVTASGQAEVTAFMERLFQAPADVARSTLLTLQKALEDGLDSSAMSLIEKLANMQLIDQYILKIQDQLPSGSTKVLESQIGSAEQVKPELDTAQDEAALLAAQDKAAAVEAQLATSMPELQDHQKHLATLKVKLADNSKIAAERGRIQAAASLCKVLPEPVVGADVELLEGKVAEQAAQKALRWSHEQMLRLKCSSTPILKPSAELRQAVKDLETQISGLRSRLTEAQTTLAVLKTLKITETVCGLCDKDLSIVPEVIAKNEKNDARIAELLALGRDLQAEVASLEVNLAAAAAALADDKSMGRSLPLEHVAEDLSVTPRQLSWTGPAVATEVDTTDWVSQLKAAKTAAEELRKVQLHNESVARRLDDYADSLANLQYAEVSDEERYAEAAEPELFKRVSAQTLELKAQQQLVSQLQSSIKNAELVYSTELRAWEAGQKRRKELLTLLEDTQANNSLISKLREARPVVARELWALVLSGVSHYFSQIRGVPSVVTRSTEGFLIDGKGIKRYSGSTKDTLGVANRLMLQKTFLPDVSMMLIDEPGAAFDSSREASMLGVLSSLGIEQIIVVTHSDIADGFAANVIRI